MSEARPLVVAALGGNALAPPDRPVDPDTLRETIAAAALAPLAERCDLIVTHGNGPQVGYSSPLDGVPVVRDAQGLLHGVEAVVDKDLASVLLACDLGADAVVLLTDVPGVYADWPAREDLRRETSIEALRALDLASGSMGPKVEAAVRFVEAGGGLTAIGALDDAAALLSGEAGTVLRG